MPATKKRRPSTNSHLLQETVCTLREVCNDIPNGGRSFSTVFRWHQRGISGIRLETYKIGQRLITSREAVQRFLDATQG